MTPANGAVPGGGTARNLTDQDVDALRNRQRAPDIASVTPSMTGAVSLTAGQATERVSLVGTTENYLDVVDRRIAEASWFTTVQEPGEEKVAVIGEQAVALLWGPAANLSQVVGSELQINHTTFRVIGVLVPDGQNDNVVMTPFGAARAYLVGTGNGKVSQIIIKSTSAATVTRATSELTAILDKQHYIKNAADQDFNVRASQASSTNARPPTVPPECNRSMRCTRNDSRSRHHATAWSRHGGKGVASRMNGPSV